MNLSKQEFLNSGESSKYIKSNCIARQKLEKDVAEWLSNGGMITDLGVAGNVPKPIKEIENKGFVSVVKTRMLRMKIRKFGRAHAPVRKLAGIQTSRFYTILHSIDAVLTECEYEAISNAIKQINSDLKVEDAI